ncbi:MAG TPA: PDDEXK nuclease domain-containing protein [Chitinophagaceae bacterium]|nr:PDDEXK nuclease domain-containing protein [Chitinophagaceae bacterium]
MNFKELISQLHEVNHRLRENAIRAVNTSLTIRNWFFGFYIVEFEQNGSDRAGYGEKLLFNIAQELKNIHIPNTDERELRRFRQFYLSYRSAFHYIITQHSIRGLLPPESAKLEKDGNRELSTPELEITDSYYEMHKGDNPPIGILLCTEKDAEHVAFATAGIEDKIFVSKYLVELPDKKELEQFIISSLKKGK